MKDLVARLKIRRGKTKAIDLEAAKEFLERNGIDIREVVPIIMDSGYDHSFHDLSVRPEEEGKVARVTGVHAYTPEYNLESVRSYGPPQMNIRHINYFQRLNQD